MANEEDFEVDAWPFSAKGDYNDVPVPRGGVCGEISRLLGQADEQAGAFSFGGPANTLPVAPGLFVAGLGPIFTPLSAEQAEKLIALCEKSPYGHNHDTKMDENVRKSWQLQPNLVELKNPQWQTGMEKLSKVVAERLGYEGIPLECILYKLLVYGEGGHFVKHQDTEKEDGMIATLVIQPPSVHEGGDLVVYRGGKVTFRHDFGKADGTAAYLPHYAVHYADSEHALEEVTKGFRLVLVYSVCLPKTMRHLKMSEDQPLSESLAEAIEKMDNDNDSFALLLDHTYTQKSIRDLGAGALKGVDSSRFHALEGANALLPTDKKLHFSLAQLIHDVFRWSGGDDSKLQGHHEAIIWYSTEGERLGTVKTTATKLNFLNPQQQTFGDLWMPHGITTKEGGFMGNEGSTAITTYGRFAVVAWVATKHPENTLKFMPLEIAADAHCSGKSSSSEELKKFLDGVIARLEAEKKAPDASKKDLTKDYDEFVSISFCCTVCEMFLKVEDPQLVNMFFEKFCHELGGAIANDTVIPIMIKLVRKFEWSEIEAAVLYVLGENNTNPIETTLRVADGLDNGPALDALAKIAVDKAEKVKPRKLFSSKFIGLLWKEAIRCSTDAQFLAIANMLENAEPDLLGPTIQYLAQYLNGSDEKDKKFAALTAIVGKRIEWLKTQIGDLDKPFSWEMPDAGFSAKQESSCWTYGEKFELPQKEKILEFLRSSEVSMVVQEAQAFKTIQEAHNFVATWMREDQLNCSFKMEVVTADGSTTVTITKTRDAFVKQQNVLMKYKNELRDLTEHYDADADGNEAKRPRLG